MPLTQSLQQKHRALLERIAGFERVAVAFSGGVDSSVVAKAAQLACGDRAIALTAVSSSLAQGEREIALEVARTIGIRHKLVETEEFENEDYLRNGPDRCYFCKTELYDRLDSLRERFGFAVILNGANLDDRGDHRPGMQAAQEHAVDSPLLETGFTKEDVRELARAWQLPVWDKPASPCLSSRIAYGLAVTPERVARVDAAESFLKELLDERELRVRHETNDLARIEIPVSALPKLSEEAVRSQVVAKLRELGFRYITLDLEGFRSGSLNAMIPVEQLRVL
ncbi:MAG TPA: ATP-dependent sacrificial sulfur transferase LarE [Planctomycetaceae bacterium]|nr:ATP-dependent sacrificial sulfur transferase LarE [Planctomycetaceae bacterium]